MNFDLLEKGVRFQFALPFFFDYIEKKHRFYWLFFCCFTCQCSRGTRPHTGAACAHDCAAWPGAAAGTSSTA